MVEVQTNKDQGNRGLGQLSRNMNTRGKRNRTTWTLLRCINILTCFKHSDYIWHFHVNNTCCWFKLRDVSVVEIRNMSEDICNIYHWNGLGIYLNVIYDIIESNNFLWYKRRDISTTQILISDLLHRNNSLLDLWIYLWINVSVIYNLNDTKNFLHHRNWDMVTDWIIITGRLQRIWNNINIWNWWPNNCW